MYKQKLAQRFSLTFLIVIWQNMVRANWVLEAVFWFECLLQSEYFYSAQWFQIATLAGIPLPLAEYARV